MRMRREEREEGEEGREKKERGAGRGRRGYGARDMRYLNLDKNLMTNTDVTC